MWKVDLKAIHFQQVAILSMHQSGASNSTDVVFGVLSNPINSPINPVSLSVLRSSLIQLFLRQFNLTLTTSIFGQPSEFEILKFPAGITIIPSQSASIWQIPQILFNFTLYNSISEIEEKFIELKDQLKYGLRLRSYEVWYQFRAMLTHFTFTNGWFLGGSMVASHYHSHDLRSGQIVFGSGNRKNSCYLIIQNQVNLWY